MKLRREVTVQCYYGKLISKLITSPYTRRPLNSWPYGKDAPFQNLSFSLMIWYSLHRGSRFANFDVIQKAHTLWFTPHPSGVCPGNPTAHPSPVRWAVPCYRQALLPRFSQSVPCPFPVDPFTNLQFTPRAICGFICWLSIDVMRSELGFPDQFPARSPRVSQSPIPLKSRPFDNVLGSTFPSYLMLALLLYKVSGTRAQFVPNTQNVDHFVLIKVPYESCLELFLSTWLIDR